MLESYIFVRMSGRKRITIELFRADTNSNLALPYADEGIQAGFPNPAQDYLDLCLDLNKELVTNPPATFYGRVRGDSLVDADVLEGDVLIVDKSLTPLEGDLVVVFIDGDFTLKFIHKDNEVIWLIPANSKYNPIKVTKENDFMVWGVVTYTIRDNRKRKRR